MGSNMAKPVLLKNIQIEGQKRVKCLCWLHFACVEKVIDFLKNNAIFTVFSQPVLSILSIQKVLHTHQSVFLVSQGPSVTFQAPLHVNPVLGTLSLVTEPVHALHVTLPLSMQVRVGPCKVLYINLIPEEQHW